MMMRGMGRFGFCLRHGSVGEKVVGWMGGWIGGRVGDGTGGGGKWL